MRKIIQLDETLSNMIAAGEVVENMASVVKELTENALDAQATDVEIHLIEAGLEEIKIIDNGYGIDSDDLSIALKRHATSKIRTIHDLYHVASLGFRGEALPSIASVSELVLESATQDVPGRSLTVKSGEIIKDVPSPPRKGTMVTVKKLFYNTPARLKHLKSPQRELSFIVEHINKIALSHPFVRFVLTHNKKTILKTNGDGNILKILHEIYDTDIAKNMVPFNNKNNYFKIEGMLCKPSHTRSTRQHITLIANKRIIRNHKILQAILQGYRTYLPVQKYPIVYLNITVDPLLIDVNIHPQKLDIKFTEEALLINLITETVRQTLANENLIPEVSPIKSKPQAHPSLKLKEDTSAYNTYENKEEPQERPIHSTTQAQTPTSQKLESTIPDMDYVGQIMGTYLIFQNEKGLFMIDQHAAAERIRYEQYRRHMSQDDQTRKPLLVPFDIHLSNAERIAYKDIKNTLASFGLKTDEEKQTIIITEIPNWFPESQAESYAERMIRMLLNERELHIETLIDQLAKDLACKDSIKANKYLTKEEINKLMTDLRRTKRPYTCPHGRPTIIEITINELETMFKRVNP